MKVRAPAREPAPPAACGSPALAPRKARRALGRCAAGLAAALVLAAPGLASAQYPGGFGPGGGFGGPGRMPGGGLPGGRQPKKAPPKPTGPETHAASGADDSPTKLPSQEPTLPEDPLAVPKEVQSRIGSDWDPNAHEKGTTYDIKRRFYGLYYQEDSGDYHFKTAFPLWAERNQPNDRASLFTPFYFNRRGKDHDADVLFPLFWRLRNFDTTTLVVGPFGRVEKTTPAGAIKEEDTWLAPLFFSGHKQDGSGYFHVPPLLTFTQWDRTGGLNIAGPAFCKWRGGSVCDPRTADKLDMGVAPFYFFGKDEYSEYEIFPPLLHYYSYSDIGDASLSVWGPYVSQHSREKDSTWLLPFYYHSWGKNEDSLTLFPLFHKSHKGKSSLFVNPLWIDSTSEDGSTTFASLLYAKYRGRTRLDMYTPFWWEYEDPDIQLKRRVVFPFVYQQESARSSDFAFFPFYGHFVRRGVSNSTWVTPLFRHTTDLTGWETDLFPIFYSGRDNQSNHLVIAPFFWDFSSPKSRTTIAAPVFFRFEDEETISQLALNTFYREKKGSGEWEFHIFPFMNFGETRTGHYWNLFYGLAGYSQEGTKTRIKALYFPITISE